MVVNCDLVVASSTASFALTEVKRGVVAIAGALPRLPRIIGRQRAMEMALTGRTVPVREAKSWGLVNEVVGSDSEKRESVVERAVEVAGLIAGNSPDSVIVSRQGIMLGWEGLGVGEAAERLAVAKEYKELLEGDNIKEGLRAFVEKRKPSWTASKL